MLLFSRKRPKLTVKKLCRSTFLSIFNIGEEGIGFGCNILIYKVINLVIRFEESHKNEQKPHFQKLRFSAENHRKIQNRKTFNLIDDV